MYLEEFGNIDRYKRILQKKKEKKGFKKWKIKRREGREREIEG